MPYQQHNIPVDPDGKTTVTVSPIDKALWEIRQSRRKQWISGKSGAYRSGRRFALYLLHHADYQWLEGLYSVIQNREAIEHDRRNK